MASTIFDKPVSTEIQELKNTQIYYGTCTTSAATQAKTCSIDGIKSYYTGLSVRIKFTKYQGYDGQPTLNINSLGAVNICKYGTVAAGKYEWIAGHVIDLVYDGTNFVMVSVGSNVNYGTATRVSGVASEGTISWWKIGKLVFVNIIDLKLSVDMATTDQTTAFATGLPASANNSTYFVLQGVSGYYSGVNDVVDWRCAVTTDGTLRTHYSGASKTLTYAGQVIYATSNW